MDCGNYLFTRANGVNIMDGIQENAMKTLEQKQIEREEVFVVFCMLVMKIAIIAAVASLFWSHV